MTRWLLVLVLMSLPASARPTLEEVRKEMGIASSDEVRGQRDRVGYASTPEGMARVWELSAQGPMPAPLGEPVPAGVAGVIGPHDDYIYTGRVYRQVFPLVTAKTVIVVGVFHRYRRFEARDQLVFDTYRAWRSPDGEIPVSDLREDLVAALPAGMAVKDAAAHDNEHSVEGIAYFLKHARTDVRIVPIIVPAASFERLSEMAHALGTALAGSMKTRGWTLGRDVAIVVSADGTHYGEDFKYTPYGPGGVDALLRTMARDRDLIRDTLGGELAEEKSRRFFATVVDPANPDQYRATWCGRFSITFGTLFLAETARQLGGPALKGYPLSLGVSVDTPELDVRGAGLGPTAPANLHHFVTHPAVAYASDPQRP